MSQFIDKTGILNGNKMLIAPTMRGWVPGTLDPQDGRAYFARFVVPTNGTITRLIINVDTPSASNDNTDIGLYTSSSGSGSLTRVVSIGSIANYANSSGLLPYNITDQAVAGGSRYYVVWTVDAPGAALRLTSASIPASTGLQVNMNPDSVDVGDGVEMGYVDSGATNVFPLPSVINDSDFTYADHTTVTDVPLFGVEFI